MNEHAPAHLVRHGDNASLIFSQWDAAYPVFQARGRAGHGYDWAGVVGYLVEKHAPTIAGELRYDPEAGMFAVVSTSEAALGKVGELIRLALSDERVLGDAIDHTSKTDRRTRGGSPRTFASLVAPMLRPRRRAGDRQRTVTRARRWGVHSVGGAGDRALDLGPWVATRRRG